MEDVYLQAKVGGRFLCEGHYGTIRYVGEVPPTPGAWLGVEWDDPSRGKHSGTHEGKQYFTCSVEGSGSFLRPKKANLGITFIQAVQERYKGGSGKADEGQQLYVDVKPVEMIGWDQLVERQSRLDELKEVSVREMLVSSAGPPNEIASTTPGIVRLDLSENHLLSSWETVQEIASQLTVLTSLQLSENKHLNVPLKPLPLTLEASGLPSLRALYLNKMELTWNKVSAILTVTPNLEELHVCENRIETVSGESIPRSLQLLNLEENEISDWRAVLSLRMLPKLKMIILNDNKLESLSDQDAISQNDFVNVECLCLNGNAIAHWSSVTSLASWPALTDLKFKGNPLNKGASVSAMRQLLIARLEKLKSLNYSTIPAKERVLAERFYVKRYASDYLAASRDPVASSSTASLFHSEHPRYAHLVSVHGLPAEVCEQGERSKVPATGLISVRIKCPDDPSRQELAKKLPLALTVQKLKGMLQRLYKVDSMQQKLSYLDKQGSHEIGLDDDLRQLSFYSMADGDTVLLRW